MNVLVVIRSAGLSFLLAGVICELLGCYVSLNR